MKQRLSDLQFYNFLKIVAITLCIALLPIKKSTLTILSGKASSLTAFRYTPWKNVGGCGLGGSGEGSKGIKWIGRGVSGGVIEVEILPRFNFGHNFYYLTIPPRFSFNPTWNIELGLTIPFTSKTAEVQYRSNQPATTFINGGTGDIGLDFLYTLGSENQYSLNFSLSFPTGQYDEKKGPANQFLPGNLQKGKGIYTAGISFSYTRDIENGLLIFDASFSYPFNMKPFKGENRFLNEYFSSYKGEINNKRFYYRFKPYGENDLGDYTPPSLGAGIAYAYRGIPDHVHSFGFSFSAPFGVGWIHSEKSSFYDPRPDPNHKAWQVLLSYGLEFSREQYPIFIGIGLPILDKSQYNKNDETDSEPMKKWNQPAWEDIFQQWIIGIGIKSAMF